jgi:hypothetical protein
MSVMLLGGRSLLRVSIRRPSAAREGAEGASTPASRDVP